MESPATCTKTEAQYFEQRGAAPSEGLGAGAPSGVWGGAPAGFGAETQPPEAKIF